MTLKRKLMLAAVGVLALAGAGTAIAATTGHGRAAATAVRIGGTPIRAALGLAGHRSGHPFGGPFAGPRGFGRHGLGRHAGPAGDLAAAATYLGITTDDLLTQLQAGKTLAQVADATSGKSATGLISALVAHEKQELAAAVSAGRLTQAQADAISVNLEQRVTDLVNRARPAHPGPGFGHRGPGGLIATAATYLGITPSALLTDLQSGKTLAQVADATSGKSAAGLIAALVAHEKQELAAAVSAGRLTQAQADAISADLQQRITDLVNGVRPAAPQGPPRPPWGGHRI